MGADPQLTGVLCSGLLLLPCSTAHKSSIGRQNTRSCTTVVLWCNITITEFQHLLDTLYPISQILPFGTWWYLSELTILNPFLVIVFLDPLKGLGKKICVHHLFAPPTIFMWLYFCHIGKLSYWKTLSTPSAFISFGMFANCSQVCDCQGCVHKLNFFIFLIPLWCYVHVTTRLSTVGQDEGGPSWSSLHREPESRPEEENALEVKKCFLRGRQSKTLTEYQNAPAALQVTWILLSWVGFSLSHTLQCSRVVTAVQTLAICEFIGNTSLET